MVLEFSNFMEADSLTGSEKGNFAGMFISTQVLHVYRVLQVFLLRHPKSGEIYTLQREGPQYNGGSSR